MYAHTRTAIVDQGNPGAWHGTSASATPTTVGCAIDAEVFFSRTAQEGLTLKSLYSCD